jgi:hypothetical protein
MTPINKLGAKIMKRLINIILTLTFSFSLLSGQGLKSDKIINKVFNETEIVELKKILTFFDREIQKLSDEANLFDCYHAYFEQHINNFKLGTIEPNISIDKQMEFYKTIDNAVLHEVWVGIKEKKQNEEKYRLVLDLNDKGKYIKFLKLLSSKNSAIKDYHEGYLFSGSIITPMTGNIIMNHNKFNIRDEKIRLVIAIHYLTLNDKLHSQRIDENE